MQENSNVSTEESLEEAVFSKFFSSISRMQNTLATLCDCHTTPQTDPVTQTVLIMITCPVQVQLTAVGWQPFKGKELTFPYQKMNQEQKEAIKALLTDEKQHQQWSLYEHAVTYKRKNQTQPTRPSCLRALDVLEAMCATILKSTMYTERYMRVAVCNILLQRVQASIPVDKNTINELNSRLFPPAKCPPTQEQLQMPAAG